MNRDVSRLGNWLAVEPYLRWSIKLEVSGLCSLLRYRGMRNMGAGEKPRPCLETVSHRKIALEYVEKPIVWMAPRGNIPLADPLRIHDR